MEHENENVSHQPAMLKRKEGRDGGAFFYRTSRLHAYPYNYQATCTVTGSRSCETQHYSYVHQYSLFPLFSWELLGSRQFRVGSSASLRSEDLPVLLLLVRSLGYLYEASEEADDD
jgi:hypothetical protein